MITGSYRRRRRQQPYLRLFLFLVGVISILLSCLSLRYAAVVNSDGKNDNGGDIYYSFSIQPTITRKKSMPRRIGKNSEETLYVATNSNGVEESTLLPPTLGDMRSHTRTTSKNRNQSTPSTTYTKTTKYHRHREQPTKSNSSNKKSVDINESTKNQSINVHPNLSKQEISAIRKNGTLRAEYNKTLLTFPQTSTIPWPNETTLAYYEGFLRSGFRNQIMAFTILILEALRQGHGQILLDSIRHKDTYGSDKSIKFEQLWNVEHWNSHYPNLPRLVHYDPILHDQYNGLGFYRFGDTTTNQNYYTNVDHSIQLQEPNSPYGFGSQQSHLLSAYIRYANKGKGPYTQGGHRHSAEITMLQGALRPHSDLQRLIDQNVGILTHAGNATATNMSTTTIMEYMTLHARIEPDMQRHSVCVEKKVVNLTQIFEMMQQQWKDPPVSRLFIPINRAYLEKEGIIDDTSMMEATNTKQQQPPRLSQEQNKNNKKNRRLRAKDPINWMAVENLQALNHAREHGLWNGRVKVFEFVASTVLQGTQWEHRPSTTGALMNFFIAQGAKVFVGTEVSTFSHDVVAARFYQGHLENYKYLPDGIHLWTPPGMQDPPGFGC